MAKYTVDGGEEKEIRRLKIVLCIISNLLVIGAIFLLQISSVWLVILLFIGLNIFWLMGFLKSTYKSFTLTSTSLDIKLGRKAKQYLFSDMKNIRFYYNSFVNEGGQRLKGLNVCEITFSDGKMLEIIEDEMANFNDFKMELISKTQFHFPR